MDVRKRDYYRRCIELAPVMTNVGLCYNAKKIGL
jgi:hypothetical protein